MPPQKKPSPQQEKEKKPGKTKQKQREKGKDRRPVTSLDTINEVVTETETPTKENGEEWEMEVTSSRLGLLSGVAGREANGSEKGEEIGERKGQRESRTTKVGD